MVSIKTYHEGDDKCVSECTMPEKMDKEEKKVLSLLPLDGNIMQEKNSSLPRLSKSTPLVIQLHYQNVVFCFLVLTLRTQFGIVWVLGERWWVLITMTVMMMDAMTNTMVKSMYFPMSGTALEVDGISSTMTSRNTVRDNRTEMLRVIFSPGRHHYNHSLFLSLCKKV